MICLVVWCVIAASSCHYYEEYRLLESTADLQDVQTELLKAYRLCLTKYQEESLKAKDVSPLHTISWGD
jgi:hypothetical protein